MLHFCKFILENSIAWSAIYIWVYKYLGMQIWRYIFNILLNIHQVPFQSTSNLSFN